MSDQVQTNFKSGRNAAQRRKDRLIEDQYREWIHTFALCVKCYAPAVDNCHVRDHAQGYMKPAPEHTFPGCRRCHELQETDREFFAPLTIEEVCEYTTKIFNAWAIAQDADLWLSRVHDLHMAINPISQNEG